MQPDNDFVFTVGANEIYRLDFHLLCSSNAVADFKYAMSVTGDATITYSLIPAYDTNYVLTADQVGTWPGTATPIIKLQFDGIINGGNSGGTVTYKWAQNTADLSDTKVLAGSHMVFTRLV